jgi:hypothetical protein
MSVPVKKTSAELDGFAGFDDSIEGEEERQSGQGPFIKFKDGVWMRTSSDEPLPPDLKLVVVGIDRVLQKWGPEGAPETTLLEPGAKFPDVKPLNDQAPKSEWRVGPDGKLVGPYQAASIVRLLNPETMDRFSWSAPTTTIGSCIAVRDLVDRTIWMRKLRGANVFPVVTLSDTFMPTRWEGRQRPHFKIEAWVTFGPEGQTALPTPEPTEPPHSQTAQLEQFAAATEAKPPQTPPQPPQSGMRTVEPPSAKEVTDDEIPSDGGESSSDQKVLSPPHQEHARGGTGKAQKGAAPRRRRA